MNEFFYTSSILLEIIAEEQPRRILEISGGGNRCGRFLKTAQRYYDIREGYVDRIALDESPLPDGDSPYREIHGINILTIPCMIDNYDLIYILDYFERADTDTARRLLDALQYKVTKQIMIVTPRLCRARYQKYHPVVFLGLDFSYSQVDTPDGGIQVYNVFPKRLYDSLRCDQLPRVKWKGKLRVAFVLPHQNLTGGMKALLQQIRQLSKRGHIVKVYYRSDKALSAIPAWSDLTDRDYTQQVLVSARGRYLDYIEGVDVIFLGWMGQVSEFAFSKIPTVLWEQGSEKMYGDYKKHLTSKSSERLFLHSLFRTPIHLMAVSVTNIAVLKGIYNRDASLFPVGIDTDSYYPAEKEHDAPIIMLAGNPTLAFKGFRFAFDVLKQAYADGMRFQVKWASPVPVKHGRVEFPLEIIIMPSQPELAALYRHADIFLSTSLYESYPLPPLEAMASGTAVIATDNGGIRTYAVDGENCILCRQGDQSAVADALQKLLNNPDARRRLANAGRTTALAHSAERTVQILEDRLADIVQQEGRICLC